MYIVYIYINKGSRSEGTKGRLQIPMAAAGGLFSILLTRDPPRVRSPFRMLIWKLKNILLESESAEKRLP